jgi:hypothetical protein
MKKLSILIAVSLMILTATGANSQVIIKIKPPIPRVRMIMPPRPSLRHIWIDGYWRWNHRLGKYVWVNGYWIIPRRGLAWVPGFWMDVPGGYRWNAPHWRRR